MPLNVPEWMIYDVAALLKTADGDRNSMNGCLNERMLVTTRSDVDAQILSVCNVIAVVI